MVPPVAPSSIVPVEGAIQHYAWGSTTAIPALLGLEPTGEPQAELWLGDHPRGPARLVDGGQALGEVLGGSPLPFLLKVLAAAAPLSLQAHPSPEQAAEGFAREEAAGIPLDAAHRNYRDASHKPELICALAPFRALCGFRDPGATVELLRSLHVDGLHPVVDALADGDVRAAVEAILASGDDLPAEVASACALTSAGFEAERASAQRLAHQYPGDHGVVLALLLNLVELAPDEALELPAGNLHAYLEGVGIELMANSDNVVRAGLTAKHVDVAELMAILDCTPMEVRPLHPRTVAPGVEVWDSVAPDFGLFRLRPASEPIAVEPWGPEMLLVTDGTVTAADVPLGRGRAAFVPPTVAAYTVTGTGTVYRATAGPA